MSHKLVWTCEIASSWQNQKIKIFKFPAPMVQIPVNWFVRTGSIVQCDKICDKLLHLRSSRNHVQDAVPDEQRSVLNNHVRKAKIKIFKNHNFSDFVELDSDFSSSFSSEIIWYGTIRYSHRTHMIWGHVKNTSFECILSNFFIHPVLKILEILCTKSRLI